MLQASVVSFRWRLALQETVALVSGYQIRMKLAGFCHLPLGIQGGVRLLVRPYILNSLGLAQYPVLGKRSSPGFFPHWWVL